MTFYDRLLSLAMMFSRSVHVVTAISTSFLFILFFIYSSIDGHSFSLVTETITLPATSGGELRAPIYRATLILCLILSYVLCLI